MLNRYRKTPGFGDSDIEAAAGTKVLWKIPNQYPAISSSIDRGVPAVQQNHSEIARAFADLARRVHREGEAVKRSTWSLFGAGQ